MTLGERIVHHRNKAGLTQKALAERMGISNARLNYWEKDKREPDVKMLNLLCQSLDVDANVLLGKEENTENAKTPPSRVEPGRGEPIGTEDTYQFLVSLGLVEEGFDLSDRDLEFLRHIQGLYMMWLDERRQKA